MKLRNLQNVQIQLETDNIIRNLSTNIAQIIKCDFKICAHFQPPT